MAITAAELLVKVGADTGDAEKELEGFGGRVKNIMGGLAMGAVAGVGAAAAGLAGIIVSGMGDAREAIAISKQTEAVLKSTGGAAGMTAQSVADLATSLSGVTNFEDDAIQSGENMLLTFTNIGEDVFPQVTEMALDMSTALGQDMTASAMQLGKALNDPAKGMAALQRVGVSFTKQQEKQIKAMSEAGDVAGAQAIILAELSREFGGSARAVADPVTQLTNAWGNFKEAAATAVIPVLNRLAQAVMPALLRATENIGPALMAGMDALSSFGQTVATVVGPVIEAVSGPLGAAFTAVRDVAATAWVSIAGAVTTAWATIQPTLSTWYSYLATTLPGAWTTLKDAAATAWSAIAAGATAGWALIEPTLSTMKDWLVTTIPTALATMAGWATGAWVVIAAGAKIAWAVIEPTLTTWKDWLLTTLPGAFASLQASAQAAWDGIKAIFTGKVTLPEMVQKVVVEWVVPALPEIPIVKAMMPKFSIAGSFAGLEEAAGESGEKTGWAWTAALKKAIEGESFAATGQTVGEHLRAAFANITSEGLMPKWSIGKELAAQRREAVSLEARDEGRGPDAWLKPWRDGLFAAWIDVVTLGAAKFIEGINKGLGDPPTWIADLNTWWEGVKSYTPGWVTMLNDWQAKVAAMFGGGAPAVAVPEDVTHPEIKEAGPAENAFKQLWNWWLGGLQQAPMLSVGVGGLAGAAVKSKTNLTDLNSQMASWDKAMQIAGANMAIVTRQLGDPAALQSNVSGALADMGGALRSQIQSIPVNIPPYQRPPIQTIQANVPDFAAPAVEAEPPPWVTDLLNWTNTLITPPPWIAELTAWTQSLTTNPPWIQTLTAATALLLATIPPWVTLLAGFISALAMSPEWVGALSALVARLSASPAWVGTFRSATDRLGSTPGWLSNLNSIVDKLLGWSPRIAGNAGGVRNFGGGLSWVGENGPELVYLPKGSDVYSNGESRAMAAGGGPTIHIHANGYSATDARRLALDVAKILNRNS